MSKTAVDAVWASVMWVSAAGVASSGSGGEAGFLAQAGPWLIAGGCGAAVRVVELLNTSPAPNPPVTWRRVMLVVVAAPLIGVAAGAVGAHYGLAPMLRVVVVGFIGYSAERVLRIINTLGDTAEAQAPGWLKRRIRGGKDKP